MKKLILMVATVLAHLSAMAQKQLYIPDEWRHPWNPDTLLYAENDPDNKYTWSRSRSVESDNVIVFWDKGYGSVLPSKSPSAYRVDEQDLLRKCEAFYDLEINKLGFVDPTKTNLRNYKVMVLLNHTTDWVCYGGGYDFEVSALWLGPSACKPVGHSVAHEVGHSFHYMCYADASGNKHTSSQTIATGFHLPIGNGAGIWEQTAQWQAAQSYPELMFEQSINVFRNSHNYAFSHEWHRYQSYWLLYYLCQYYDDIQTVGKVWRQPMTAGANWTNSRGESLAQGKDFNETLMNLKGLKVKDLYRLYYDYAAHCATWDFEACAPYREPYIGDFSYRCVQLPAVRSYQVALASTPQSTGFNIIPLQVPEAGTQVTTHFTALLAGAKLAEGDPAEMMNGETAWGKTGRTTYIRPASPGYRGFRLGYVALMQDGSRQYFSNDSIYCTGSTEKTEDVTMTMPEGVKRLWLIVSPSPKTYTQHKWTEQADNAEHWPYRFYLEGTDLSSQAIVYVEPIIDGREVSNITYTYDVTFPFDATGYSGTQVTVSGKAGAMLGTAFQMQLGQIGGKMQTYSSQGPTEGHIMFYAVDASGNLEKRGSTANGYGHWFNASGKVSDYGSGFVYSEFSPTTLTFTLGQYPGKCKQGNTYAIRQALQYRQSATATATARFIFNVTIGPAASVTLRGIDYQDPTAAIFHYPSSITHHLSSIHNLQGHKVADGTNGLNQLPKGIYLVDRQKVAVR